MIKNEKTKTKNKTKVLSMDVEFTNQEEDDYYLQRAPGMTPRYTRPKTKLKKSRVSDLFIQFEKLSQIEKINFINLIKNYG